MLKVPLPVAFWVNSISLFLKKKHKWRCAYWGTGVRGGGVSIHVCPCIQEKKKSSYLGLKKGALAFSVSCAINQCPGQPGREHFQTHLQQIMPAIPPSPRDRKASLMNHCPFRSAAEWSSPCCVYRVLLCLPAKTATKIGRKENDIWNSGRKKKNWACWKRYNLR